MLVLQNPKKAQRQWGIILRVLTKTVATVRSHGIMYKAVSHCVLLYGSEIWLVTGATLKVMEGFHQRVARRITGMTAKRVADGEWEYPPVVEAL